MTIYDPTCGSGGMLTEAFKTNEMGTRFRVSSQRLGTGSSGFMRLYTDDFGSIAVSVPPREEQREIVELM